MLKKCDVGELPKCKNEGLKTTVFRELKTYSLNFLIAAQTYIDRV